MHERAGTPATESDLIDVEALLRAYYDLHPDVSIPEQRVVFANRRFAEIYGLAPEDVKRMGGQEGVYRFRASLYRGYADGGAVGYVQPTYVQSPRYAGGGGSTPESGSVTSRTS